MCIVKLNIVWGEYSEEPQGKKFWKNLPILECQIEGDKIYRETLNLHNLDKLFQWSLQVTALSVNFTCYRIVSEVYMKYSVKFAWNKMRLNYTDGKTQSLILRNWKKVLRNTVYTPQIMEWNAWRFNALSYSMRHFIY